MARAKKQSGSSKKNDTDAVIADNDDMVMAGDTEMHGPAMDTDIPEQGHTDDSLSPAQADAAGSPVVSTTVGPVPRWRGGFSGMLLGGAIAAAIGFVAAQYLGNTNWPFQRGPSPVAQLETRVEEQKLMIDALSEQLADVSAKLEPPAPDARIADLIRADEDFQKIVNGLSGRLDTLERRLQDLENRPIPEVGATAEAVATYERELAGMRAMLETELARIEAAQKNAVAVEQSAAERAENAVIRAALVRLGSAVDNGAPLTPVLDDLRDAGVVVPPELNKGSATGVATLVQLQRGFPEAARAAVSAATKAQADSGEIGKLTAFFRNQLGARSLNPREGEDADAVLSRAEAALQEGDIGRALSELSALPEAAKPALSAWIAIAENRQEIVAAAVALNKTLGR